MSTLQRFDSHLRRPFAGALGISVVTLLSAGIANAQARWNLVEELRIGTGDTEATTFADVRGIAVGTGGRIFVLDYRVQEIRAFDATGKFISNIARRGKGPGEISSANGLGQAPDGTIWVNDPANSRFSLFKPDGSFLRQHVVPIRSYGFIWTGIVDSRGYVNDPVFIPSASTTPSLNIRRFGPDGRGIDTLALDLSCLQTGTRLPPWTGESKNGKMMMGVPFAPAPRIQLDPAGFAWCTPTDVYRVVRLRLSTGDTVAVVERKIAPVPVTAAERAAEIARADSVLKRYETSNADYSQIPKFKPFIDALDVDDAGRLWVRRATTEPMTTTFDVFDENGRFLATATAPFKIGAQWHAVIRGDVMYTVALDEDDVQNVVRIRIRR